MQAVRFLSFDKQTIREKAYQIWQARGEPFGTNLEDWLEAERILAEELISVQLSRQGEIDPLPLIVEESDEPHSFALIELDETSASQYELAAPRFRYGLIELSSSSTNGNTTRYGLVELSETKDNAQSAARYGLVELVDNDTRRDQRENAVRLRYGLVQLSKSEKLID